MTDRKWTVCAIVIIIIVLISALIMGPKLALATSDELSWADFGGLKVSRLRQEMADICLL